MVRLSGRKYTTTPLHGPGETENGSTGEEWNGMEPLMEDTGDILQKN